jgi:hypothetical protein
VLRFPLDPRLEIDAGDRGTLGLGIHVVRRAPDDHNPSLARPGIGLVDLYRDVIVGVRDASTQVLLGRCGR